jgi:hypothetical protein
MTTQERSATSKVTELTLLVVRRWLVMSAIARVFPGGFFGAAVPVSMALDLATNPEGFQSVEAESQALAQELDRNALLWLMRASAFAIWLTQQHIEFFLLKFPLCFFLLVFAYSAGDRHTVIYCGDIGLADVGMFAKHIWKLIEGQVRPAFEKTARRPKAD